jgi:hypothetical protein
MVYMKQISEEEKPFSSSMNIFPEADVIKKACCILKKAVWAGK